jgi:hypothetical protein
MGNTAARVIAIAAMNWVLGGGATAAHPGEELDQAEIELSQTLAAEAMNRRAVTLTA